ncbi:hypothetical protein QYE76_031894 [Lolium multiflorum]|uniref:Transposase Tnp1/En/Spm-like domain-containing protein n=1 Tax=Lolium multiflorum TaxID=4521 RepID=A0AAD8QSN2_LOLMU|nr:hypothetical protein QYE76_031894 [Lolium multiflorum]
MAMEIWNINLYYEDENKNHKVLEASMDRTNISFYDLVKLIEGVGFSGIDYLYYRKKYPRGKGHLVHIDNDTHVRKMITEHNKEKRVQLYVYKERANIDVAPSEPQGEDDGHITSFEEEDAFPERATQTRTSKSQTMVRKSKRLNVVQSRAQYANGDFANSEQSRSSRELLETHELEDNEDHLTERDDNLDNGDGKAVDKRGAHSLPAIWNMPDGARIVVKCNNLGQPIGDEGGVLGKFLGTIARLGGYCPLDKKDWRNVKKDGGADTILQCVQTKFLYPAKCDKWILKTIGRDWRKFKAGLKKEFFNAKKKRKALYKLCPEYVDTDQWRELVNYWKSKEGRAVSEKNKISRASVKTSHTAGTKSYARWAEDLRQEDPEKKQPHRAKVYLATHRKKDEERNKHVADLADLEKLIHNEPELAQSDHGKVAWKGDALHTILGEEKPGQVHGMGLLPVPNQVYGRLPRYLKNINMTTTNGSSHAGESDVMEEIAKLKRRIEEQDQRIEEQDQIIEGFRNQDEANFRQGNDESQLEVPQNRRKRVHASGPEQVRLVSRPKDTIKHHPDCEGSNEFSYQGQSSLTPPFPEEREMRKSGENLDENSRRVHKQMTQNKTPSHMSSKKRCRPSEEIRNAVILKSSIYPNKRRVAYATIWDSNSKTLVGGVELGRQFTHVQIDEPIGEDERLVREREKCVTIGDAFSSGVTIAWPSACIEKFSG